MDPKPRCPVEDTRLGAILLESPVVREEDLQRCLEIQALTGNSRMLGQILVEEGIVTYEMLEELLRVQAARRSVKRELGPPLKSSAADDLVLAAARTGATDLYVCEGRPAMLRVGGSLRRASDSPPPPPAVWAMVGRLFGPKGLESLAQNYSLCADLRGPGWCGRARAFRHFDGVGIVVRLHPERLRDAGPSGLPSPLLQSLSPCKGLVLVVGEARCGVSETLARLQEEVAADPNRVVLVLDECVERPSSKRGAIVVQRRVGVHTRDWASGLLAATRSNPDVVIVADASSPEAFDLVLRLAEAGRLVIAGYRARSVAAALQRAFDAYPAHEQVRARATVASLLRCAVAQQLVPDMEGTGLLLASEILCVNDAVRDVLHEGNFGQLGLLMRLKQEYGTSMDAALQHLYRNKRIRFEDAFARAEDKTHFLTSQRGSKPAEVAAASTGGARTPGEG